jgi:hypothetical protein
MSARAEFILEAFAIVSRTDKLLLTKNHSEEKSDLDVSVLFETSLDYFDEQLSLLLKETQQPVSGNLGLLNRHDSRLLFGRVLANGAKLILLVNSHFGRQPSEASLEGAFNLLAKTYLAEVSNPFYSCSDDKAFTCTQLHTLPECDWFSR